MKTLERACRAAHDEHNDDPAAHRAAADPSWDGWKSWLPVVRAVLTAIREPSDHMVSDGAFQIFRGQRISSDDLDAARRVWRAMTKAALAEGE